MLPEKDWYKNIGTGMHPVSLIHEYAVGLLWDALQSGERVVVKTMDGSMSSDLAQGVETVVIPDDMQPIGGCVPDLALLDKDLRPLRVIEVVVTAPPTGEKRKKLETLQERGVEVVLVPVRTEEDLKALVAPEKAKPKWSHKLTHAQIDIQHRRAMTHNQSVANKQVQGLLKALVECSPEVRRQAVKVLQGMDSSESLYPLSPSNPKRDLIEGQT